MRHAPQESDDNLDLPAGDSFLDVIANLVGILVLLVVVVGVRSATKGFESVAPEPVVDLEAINAEIALREEEATNAARETRTVARQIEQLTQDVTLREITRQQHADEIATLRQDIEDQRAKLDPERRRSAAVQIELAKIEQELDRLTAQQVALIGQIAQMEDEPAQQLQIAGSSIAANRKYEPTTLFLRDGKVVPQPGNEVVEHLRAAVRSLPAPNALQRGKEYQRKIGPIDGFVVHVVFEQGPIRRGNAITAGTRMKRCVLDMNGDLVQWEPLDRALSPDSGLMRHLDTIDAEETAVILQPAPDSYEEYQTLKTELSQRGFSVVMRPMDMSGLLPVVDAPEDGYAVQ